MMAHTSIANVSHNSVVINATMSAVYADANCGVNEQYNLSAPDSEDFRYSPGEKFLLSVLLPLILVFGVIGNVMFIYVATRIPHMRTITNRYLVSLSVADVIFLTAAIGQKVWKFTKSPLRGDDTPLGTFGCVWMYFLADVGYFASLTFITLVSIDRYVAVCRPQERHSVIKGKSYEIIAICWVLSAALSASLTPGNLELGVFCVKWPEMKPYDTWPNTIRYCLPLESIHWISSFATGLQTVPFFITLVLNIALYVLIIRGLDQCIRRMSEHGVSKNKDTGMRNQIAKMLVVNGVVFFCFLAPFEIYSLFGMVATFRADEDGNPTHLIRNEDARSYILLLSQLLSYINSAINPIIYTVMCRRYKQAFKEALLPAACMLPPGGAHEKGTLMESRTGQTQMRLETSTHHGNVSEKKDTNI